MQIALGGRIVSTGVHRGRRKMQWMDMHKLAYSMAETVAASGRSRSDIYRALRSGELKAKKRGTRTLILVDELKRWLAGLPNWTPADENVGPPRKGVFR